jgi:pyruvate dehydrogenase E1 component alpha subunit
MDSRAKLARHLYASQLKIRRFEEKVATLFGSGRLPGFVHLSIGQEAVAAGACAALRTDDAMVSNHRGHGHCLAKGGDLRRMMAELFGKAEGYCKGVAGSMHIADLDLGILGANGIVGAGILIATGAALSLRNEGGDRVALAFFGDGAINEGAFHEGLNIASLWSLPVVYLCENNGYAELTPTSVHASGPGLEARASGYAIRFRAVDGTDALAVYDVVRDAVEYCRRRQGPVLVEARTDRWKGHYEGDPQAYRSREELAAMYERDPVSHLRDRILAANWGDETWLASLEESIKAEIDESVASAESGRPLSMEEMLTMAGGAKTE